MQDDPLKSTSEQKYCVVAECRITGTREMLTGPMSQDDVGAWKEEMNRTRKRDYRYFRVAKYPYKDRR